MALRNITKWINQKIEERIAREEQERSLEEERRKPFSFCLMLNGEEHIVTDLFVTKSKTSIKGSIVNEAEKTVFKFETTINSDNIVKIILHSINPKADYVITSKYPIIKGSEWTLSFKGVPYEAAYTTHRKYKEKYYFEVQLDRWVSETYEDNIIYFKNTDGSILGMYEQNNEEMFEGEGGPSYLEYNGLLFYNSQNQLTNLVIMLMIKEISKVHNWS